MIEVLPGNGYLNGVMDKEMLEYRLKREDHWIKTLRTVYPYGLNERTKYMNQTSPKGKLYHHLPRYGDRIKDTRSRTKQTSTPNIQNLDNLLQTIISFPPSNRSNELRKLLDSSKKKNLRLIAFEATSRLKTCDDATKRWLDFIVDVFLTKTFRPADIKPKKKAPKYIFPIQFENKGLDYIKMSRILHDKEIINLLPESLKDDDVPSVVYSLGKTIRNKIFNYKDAVNNIDIHDHETYGTGLRSCDCLSSEFLDQEHQHVLTGNLKIIENNDLRKLLTKGPNFREPKVINWLHCKDRILEGLDVCADRLASSKKDLDIHALDQWKSKVIEKVDEKIEQLKHKIKPKNVNPILKQPLVLEYLNKLHEHYVLVPIDKAANNIAVICKKYYVEVILKEIGVLGEGNNTYQVTDKTKDEIINENVEYSKRLHFTIDDSEKVLPIMYWTPKMHKTPSGTRYIVASKLCSTKRVSKVISNVFKLIFRQTENFHLNAKFLSNYNKFWVLQNSKPIIDRMNEINRKKNAKSISTFDFSTLYTNIPHSHLIERLSMLIDFVYDAGDLKYITTDFRGNARWSSKMSQKYASFSREKLKITVKHLIQNCFFTVGNITIQQVIGIPMGIDPAPFWANLFLYTYEEEYMSSLISTDKVKARHFHSCKRFIDDLCAINDGGEFGRVCKDIYPEELELKVEHSGTHATFLNLDISIEEGVFVYKLFDKRDAFPFYIVRMPHMCSNIPQQIFYSSLVGEFLRIAMSTLRIEDFLPKAKDLILRMSRQGARNHVSIRFLRKIILHHPEAFSQFNMNHDELLSACCS